MPGAGIERAIYVQAPFGSVWTAITEPEWHEDWHLAPCLAFGKRKGARCEWGEQGSPLVVGTIAAFSARAGELAHTFSFSFLDDPESLVEWRVHQVGQVTAVRVQHHLDRRHAATRQVLESGWTIALSRLKTLVETGKPMALPTEDD